MEEEGFRVDERPRRHVAWVDGVAEPVAAEEARL